MNSRVASNLIVLSAFFIFLNSASAGLEQIKPKTQLVELEGTLSIAKYLNPNTEKNESVFVLTLKKPINVSKDEFGGPDLNVKKIQMVFYSKIISYAEVKEHYVNREVVVSGYLFHQVTVHHYTEVLMDVVSIRGRVK